jgi:hypothetical protein
MPKYLPVKHYRGGLEPYSADGSVGHQGRGGGAHSPPRQESRPMSTGG